MSETSVLQTHVLGKIIFLKIFSIPLLDPTFTKWIDQSINLKNLLRGNQFPVARLFFSTCAQTLCQLENENQFSKRFCNKMANTPAPHTPHTTHTSSATSSIPLVFMKKNVKHGTERLKCRRYCAKCATVPCAAESHCVQSDLE